MAVAQAVVDGRSMCCDSDRVSMRNAASRFASACTRYLSKSAYPLQSLDFARRENRAAGIAGGIRCPRLERAQAVGIQLPLLAVAFIAVAVLAAVGGLLLLTLLPAFLLLRAGILLFFLCSAVLLLLASIIAILLCHGELRER
ncbi:hypothetical protein V8Z74_18120 [Comamonas sp. w2-DMI]|uniref:hypothetical protein n=1 Tax=Comamonas sp. w2-DMI TaxID=3126391 RepID=UPI0032E40FC3